MKLWSKIRIPISILCLYVSLTVAGSAASVGLKYVTSVPMGSLKAPLSVSVATNWPAGAATSSRWQIYQMLGEQFNAAGQLQDSTGGALFSSPAKVNGKYVYAFGADGLVINDFTDPNRPVRTGGYRFRDTWGLDAVGAMVYVAAYDSGLQVVDVSNPNSTSLAGHFPSSLIDTMIACDVRVRGDYAYVAERDAGLQILRVTNPGSMTLVGRLATGSGAFALELSGNLVYVLGYGQLHIIDVTTPTKPSLVSRYPGTTSDQLEGSAIRVVGSLAFVAAKEAGVRVLDVSNPAKPVEVAAFDTFGSASDLAVANGRVFVADDKGGLVVLRLMTDSVPPPSIVVPPSNQTLPRGASVQFDVTATGSGLLSYQWLYEGMPIANATQRTLTLSQVDVAQRGRYSVVVSTDGGSVMSSSAVLGVVLPPQITEEPSDAWAVEGGSVSLFANAGPEPPLSLQWYFGGQALSRQTNASLSLTGIQMSQAGAYTFVVSNIAGTVTSRGAIVTVLPRVSLRQIGHWQLPAATNVVAEAVHVVNRYAYVAYGIAGVQILDITNPSNPVPVGRIYSDGYAADVEVVGSVAYVAASDTGGLQIFNISNPAYPILLAKVINGFSFHTVKVVGRYAYTVQGLRGLEVYDVIDPAKPKRVGQYVSGTVPRYVGLDISGDRAYVADANYGLIVLNLTDPINPTLIRQYAPGSLPAAFSGQNIQVSGNSAYLVAAYDGLYVFDLNKPGDLVSSATIDTPGFAFALKVLGNYAYVADYSAGIRVVDLSLPQRPTEVGSVDTPGNAVGVDVADKYVYVADGPAGLYIFETSGAGQVLPVTSVTINVSASPTVGGTATGGGNFNSGSSVTVNATPANGYTFVNWTENGGVVSTTASYAFIANANRTLVANFKLNTTPITSVIINVSASPAVGGTTTGGGSYSAGSTVTVIAAPANGYTFVNWTENGNVVSTTANYPFTATTNRTLVANFTTAPVTGRVLQLGNVSGAPGGPVVLPLTLKADGTENALSFSLLFSPSQATFGGIALGLGSGLANTSLVVNTNQAGSGRIGVVLSLGVNQTIPPGLQPIVSLTLNLANGLSGGTVVPVQFASSPAPKSASDTLGGDLAVNYLDGSVTVAVGYEGDVAPRPNGNNLVNAGDVTVMARIVAGLEVGLSAAEFQRADCAPRSSLGNGVISVGDLAQAARYVAGLDPLTSASGPTAPSAGLTGLSAGVGRIARKSTVEPRQASVMNSTATPGGTVFTAVQLVGQGNENAISFSLVFDATRLSFINAALGNGAATGSLVVNTNLAPSGKVGVVISLPVGQILAAGSVELLKLTFLAGTAPGLAVVGFGNSPAPESASDALGNDLACRFVEGAITIGAGSLSPVLVAQPASVAVAWGGSAALSVSATGATAYQWQRNGKEIPGANEPAFTLNNLGSDWAGVYTVVVRNSSGSVTSAPATLALFGDPKMYAGLTLAGPVGAQFRVEYSDAIGSSSNWQTLTTITLPSSPYVVIDPESPGQARRYYRAVLLP